MINVSNSDMKLTVEESSVVEINKTCIIRGYVCLDVPYKIICDLSEIPKELQQIVIQTLMIK